MDAADRAQRLEEAERAEVLALRHAAGMRLAPHSDECLECGATILAARRQALPFCTRCVACQTRHERLTIGRGG